MFYSVKDCGNKNERSKADYVEQKFQMIYTQ